jgi:hypothetical protein
MNRAFSTGDFALREFLGRRLTARPLGYITPITPFRPLPVRQWRDLSADKPPRPDYTGPKLTEAERRAIRLGLLEIANQDPDVALSNQSALEGALMLDRLENDDARHQSG